MTALAERTRIAVPRLGQDAAKRVVDMSLSLALITLLAPLLALLLCLVRLTSPGLRALPAGARRPEHAAVHDAEAADHVRPQRRPGAN